jgi:hypothetical protein
MTPREHVVLAESLQRVNDAASLEQRIVKAGPPLTLRGAHRSTAAHLPEPAVLRFAT